ncbi:hypothetical protein BD779DRAFT_677717 [Infundibulicybe gibba]|nr:hypothetical protein BD779DRAFT_677717 [Infundibulicybe gibba]
MNFKLRHGSNGKITPPPLHNNALLTLEVVGKCLIRHQGVLGQVWDGIDEPVRQIFYSCRSAGRSNLGGIVYRRRSMPIGGLNSNLLPDKARGGNR